MGKVHPDIVDAREQYSCEHPIYDFLYRNLKGPAIINRNAIILIVILVSPLASIIPPFIVIIFFIGLKLFLFDLPAKFHGMQENSFMQFIFISDIDSEKLWKDIFYLYGPASLKNAVLPDAMVIVLLIVMIFYLVSLLFIPFAFLLIIPITIQSFLIWLIFIEWGICCIYLPEWVYKSGLGAFGMIFTILFAFGMSFVPVWISMGGAMYGNLGLLLPIVFMVLYTVVLAVIAFIGWKYIPFIIEMSRRGMFDQR
jgi:hypothetical protein